MTIGGLIHPRLKPWCSASGRIEMVTPFEPTYPSERYEYQAKLPEQLMTQTKAIFLVHAIVGEGKVLVTEFQDTVVPIHVKNGELTKNLYRSDVVELTYKVMNDPAGPLHLALDETVEKPVQVIDSILSWNGVKNTLEGELIMFQKSPEIIFNVFALKQSLFGVTRQYTLVNFDDPEEFKKIREFLQKAWDKYPGEYVNGRNKFVSKRIRVRATGIINEQSPNQANPQILLESVNSLQIIEQQ